MEQKSRQINVSVVLPCYNGADTLQETLDSINIQSYPVFECVIINDGSKDSTIHIINNYKFRKGISKIVIDRENKGFLASLEEGIEKSSGFLIARIDADDLWSVDHLQSIVNCFRNDEELVLVGTNALVIDDSGNVITKTTLPLSNRDIRRYLLKDNAFVHSSVVFRRDAYYKTSGYLCGSGEFYKHISDYNLWTELSLIGKVCNLKTESVSYRFLENSMSRTINKAINYKARRYVMCKAYKGIHLNFFYFLINLIKVDLKIIYYETRDFIHLYR